MRLLAARRFSVSICMIAILAFVATGVARADDVNLDPDQIKAALRTVSDEEQGFIDRTVKMVNAGTLPRDIFTSCLIWARKKPHHKFQYFKQALIARAAAVGIGLN